MKNYYLFCLSILCLPLFLSAQPGPSHAQHKFYILDKKGDTISFDNKNNTVKLDSIVKNFRNKSGNLIVDDDEKGVVVNYEVWDYNDHEIVFTINYNKKLMHVRTVMDKLTFPFMEGSYNFTVVHEDFLNNRGLNISNFDWNFFKNDKPKKLKALITDTLNITKLPHHRYFKIYDKLIVGYNYDNIIPVSADKGKSWINLNINIPLLDPNFYEPKFVVLDYDSTYFICLTHKINHKTTVVKTKDSGKSWVIDSLLTSLQVKSFFFDKNSKISVAEQDNNSYIYMKDSIGKWCLSGNTIPKPVIDFHSITFAGKGKVYFFMQEEYGFAATPSDKYNFYSDDYGLNWSKHLISKKDKLIPKSVFINEGYGGTVLQSPSGEFYQLNQYFDHYTYIDTVKNDTTGIILGNNYILLTRDRGANWKYYPLCDYDYKADKGFFYRSNNSIHNNLIFLNKDEIMFILNDKILKASIKGL